ncbi:hypothetical protein P3L10_022233 [Capsicum annuum]
MDRDYLDTHCMGIHWVHDAKMDYASQLPDEVCAYILERMTLKDVVKTSILSRRWRYVLKDYISTLAGGKFFPTSGAIDLCPNMFFEFSLELLSQASSLKYLSLSVCIVKPSVTLRLNSLKSLFLTSVLVKSGQLESILSSCLNLSQLIIKHCKLPLELCISGAVRTVLFADCGGLKEIDLQATNLRRFECLFDDKVRFYFSSVPSLERVKIGLRGDASMPYIFGEFATNIPAQVKSLIVTAFYTQATHLPTEMQIFGNLRMLALLFESTYDSDIVKVSPVLDACPVLQYLDILVFVGENVPINFLTPAMNQEVTGSSL